MKALLDRRIGNLSTKEEERNPLIVSWGSMSKCTMQYSRMRDK